MYFRPRFQIQVSFYLLLITIIVTVEHYEENETRQNSKYSSNYVTRLYGNRHVLLICYFSKTMITSMNIVWNIISKSYFSNYLDRVKVTHAFTTIHVNLQIKYESKRHKFKQCCNNNSRTITVKCKHTIRSYHFITDHYYR